MKHLRENTPNIDQYKQWLSDQKGDTKESLIREIQREVTLNNGEIVLQTTIYADCQEDVDDDNINTWEENREQSGDYRVVSKLLPNKYEATFFNYDDTIEDTYNGSYDSLAIERLKEIVDSI